MEKINTAFLDLNKLLNENMGAIADYMCENIENYSHTTGIFYSISGNPLLVYMLEDGTIKSIPLYSVKI